MKMSGRNSKEGGPGPSMIEVISVTSRSLGITRIPSRGFVDKSFSSFATRRRAWLDKAYKECDQNAGGRGTKGTAAITIVEVVLRYASKKNEHKNSRNILELPWRLERVSFVGGTKIFNGQILFLTARWFLNRRFQCQPESRRRAHHGVILKIKRFSNFSLDYYFGFLI